MLNEKILNKKHFYILAVSGGPDSMFLLDKMRNLNYNFVVAHVNYHQREESSYDEELVKNYCQAWNLSFFTYQVQLKNHFPKKNFQAEARQIRYIFFQTVAKQWQSRHIITAHHLNDHLETYYLQKQRNSLVDNWGLASKICRKDKTKNFWILRPLLFVEKNQIYQYLTQNKIPYAVDKTNYLPLYQRNIVRQEINSLSAIEKKNLQKEIDQKNRELHQIKRVLKKQIREIITNSFFNLAGWETNSLELKLRLLYHWINRNTNNAFVNRKRQIYPEVSKQLVSPKKKITIVLNKNYQIKKAYPWAVLEKITS